MKKVAISIVVVVAIALVVCLVPLKEVAYAVMVDYEDTETYYEDEPYEAIETFYEPLEYQHLGFGSNGYDEYYNLMNRSTIAGYFTFRLTFFYMDRDKLLDLMWEYPDGIPEAVAEANWQKTIVERTVYLEPKETVYVSWLWEEFGVVDQAETVCGGEWEIIPEEVERERTVTKYRQVEKQRTVTKQREETRYKKVTLLDYWLHY